MSSNDDMFLVIIGDEDFEIPDDLKDVVQQSESNMELNEDIEEQESNEIPIYNEEVVKDENINFDTVDIVDEGVIIEEPVYEIQIKNQEVNGEQTYNYEVEGIKVESDEVKNEETKNDEIIIEGLTENNILQLENGQLQLEDGQHYLIQQENGDYILQEPFKYNIVEINGEQILLQQVENSEESVPKNDDSDVEYLPQPDEHGSSDDDIKITRRRKEKRRTNPLSSYVQELKETYPELNDEEKLIATLAEIMRTIEPPPLPDNYCVMNGIMFECSECGKFFNSMPEAARHFQYYHGERYLICFACGADFRNPTNLYKHEKGCTAYPDILIVLKARGRHLSSKGRSRAFITTTNNIQMENNRYLCSQCPASFSSRPGLEAHEHVHAGERPYLCSHCVCAYTSPSALSRHQRKHRGEMFVCEHCGKRFNQRNALDAHMDTHQPLRKYACPECPKRFAQKSSLQLHIDRVHRYLPPPCACQLCPRRYPRMSLLKQHMKKAHGMLLMTQTMFYKSLPTLTQSQVNQAKVVLKSDVESYPKYEVEEVTYT